MKKTRKRFLAMLMSLSLLLGLIPAMSLSAAAYDSSITVGGVELNSTTTCATTNSSGVVTACTGTTAPKNHYVKFESGVLTLKNAYIAGAISISNQNVTMNLLGTNCVGGGIEIGNNALTIQNGDSNKTGYLTAYGTTAGISGNGTLTVSGGNVTAYGAVGISVGTLNVSGGVLTATGKTGNGANVTGATAISGGTVTFVGGASTDNSYGLSGTGVISVTAGQVTAKGGQAATTSAGINGSTVSVSGSAEVTAVGGDAPSTYGIAGAVATAGTSKLAAVGGGCSTTDTSYGISGAVTYSDGLLVAKGGYAKTSTAATSVAVTGAASEKVTSASGAASNVSKYYVVNPGGYNVLADRQDVAGTSYAMNNTVIINTNTETSPAVTNPALKLGGSSTAITLTGYNIVLGGDTAASSAALESYAGRIDLSGSGSLVAVGGYGKSVDGISLSSDANTPSKITGVHVTAIGGTSKQVYGSNGMSGAYELQDASVVAIGGSAANFDSVGLSSLCGAVNSTVIAVGGVGFRNSLGIGYSMQATSCAITAIGGKALRQNAQEGDLYNKGSMGFYGYNYPASQVINVGGSGTAIGETRAMDTDIPSTDHSAVTGGAHNMNYMVWAPVTIVTFITSTLQSETNEVRADAEDNVALPADMSGRDNTFAGWYLDHTAYATQWAASTATTKADVEESVTVYAKWLNAAGHTVRTTALDFTQPGLQYIVSEGTAATADPTTTDINCDIEGWSWNHTTKTLTLDGASICPPCFVDSQNAVSLPDGATISLKAGTMNYIQNGYYGTAQTAGISCAGALNVTGGGVLFAMSGSVKSAGTANSYGVYSAGALSVSGDTTELLTIAHSGSSSGYAVGVYAGGAIDIAGKAMVVGYGQPCSIVSATSITTANDATIQTVNRDYTLADAVIGDSTSPAGKTVTISGAPTMVAMVNFGKASISNCTITGSVGDPILTGTAVITLTGGNAFDTLSKDAAIGMANLQGEDGKASVQVKNAVSAGSTTAEVYFSGASEAPNTGTITAYLNPTCLLKGKLLSEFELYLTTGTNANAVWNVTRGTSQRTVGLDLTKNSLTYQNQDGTSATRDPTTANITDSGEGWTWYLTASEPYDNTKSVTADNHPAKTLILDHADIEPASGNALHVPEGTTIVVKSDSTVKSANKTAVISDGNLTVTGNGKLTASGMDAGIDTNGVLTFDHASIDVSAGNMGIIAGSGIYIIGGNIKAASTAENSYGICVDDSDSGFLSIKERAAVNAVGGIMAICAKTITIDASQSITSPSGGTLGDYTLKSRTNQTVLNGTTAATSVTIGVKSDDTVVPTPITPPTTSTATSTVVVNGKTTDAGKVTTTTNSDGTKNNTVAVDPTTLEKQVTAADKGSSVVVTVPTSTGSASAQLVVKDVETMAAKDMTLDIKTGGVTYTVPATAIDTAAVIKTLGAPDATKVPVTVTITPAKQSDVKVAEGTQIAAPVKFEVTATYDGKTTEITTFNNYVSRTIEIPDGVDPSKITTGIRVEDGLHVPTAVLKDAAGKYFAKINSLTNSTYTVVYNEKSFADTTGKWYEKAVTEMASREVINGKTDTTFAGDASITRAEFAAILARALGLPEGGTNSFSDVASDAWCYGAVGAAVKYGIINGYTDGSFKPGKNISREEAMAMMQRAAKVTGYAGTTGALTGFSDASSVGSWAKSAVTFNVGSGLIQGNAGKLNPKSSITRAETAVVVLRLLQKSTLVDVRTNA